MNVLEVHGVMGETGGYGSLEIRIPIPSWQGNEQMASHKHIVSVLKVLKKKKNPQNTYVHKTVI